MTDIITDDRLAEIRALTREYRPSMDKDIVHAWAADAVPAILALLARLDKAEAGWQPIETAPAKGEFLAERQATGDWLKVQRSPLYPGDNSVNAITGLLWVPERWRPLPPTSSSES